MPTITPLDASFGAVITDIRIADMDDAEWRVVEDAFHEHAALVFPNQHLSEEEQIAFGERFGNIELLRPDPSKKAVPIRQAHLEPQEHAFQPCAKRCAKRWGVATRSPHTPQCVCVCIFIYTPLHYAYYLSHCIMYVCIYIYRYIYTHRGLVFKSAHFYCAHF